MNLSEKRPNKWWTEPDTFTMLTLIEQLDLVRELDKKRQRNESHFRRLRQSLAKQDIHFTINQIRNRWKSLKHKYRKIKLATYRSPAARLAAMESFRYFRRLDRMLACRSRTGGQEDGCGGERSLVGRSDPEDHANILGDDGVSGPVAPWSGGGSLESESESFAPKLESSADEGMKSEELASPEPSSWAAGSHEVMTLGLSGEYLYAVKTEPNSDLNPAPGTDDSREATGCGQTAGSSEDVCSLILQQLTFLNHQLEEQLAEQRAFHCSMLGMMDRQIEVLEQLSSFTQNHCHQPKPEPTENDSSISQKVQETLLRILRGMESQALQPCLSKPPPSAPPPVPPPWTVSLVEVHQRSSSVDGEVNGEAEDTKSTDMCKTSSIASPDTELLPSPPRNGSLQNRLC
ncbi:hypothetical protein AMEX_G21186 [Astyanax mexicanus]|uniref:Myb/SANT-like DNA-binding domain-containing protein n=1 Tax=Astyanax mexicanus TaxID=7994 RepID=A0A8T2L7A7_ASTMX|nr:hypothetical protein AMEX_G21186 [Astyanax mexicanus]